MFGGILIFDKMALSIHFGYCKSRHKRNTTKHSIYASNIAQDLVNHENITFDYIFEIKL